MMPFQMQSEIDELNRRFKEFWSSIPEEKRLTVEKSHKEAFERGLICNPFETINIKAIF